ncbi:MAG TPA: host-nuclease inhibitor Gam family protein, partial [Geothrix sp.]|nr:host-nuclease inhibitor Gam family protein [Geothrix sp.]
VARADALLQMLGETTAELSAAVAKMMEEIKAVEESWRADLEILGQQQQSLEAEVVSLAKMNRDSLFSGDSDRLDLPHGALLFEVQRRVKRGRGVLEQLKERGFLEAVKVSESVDWDQLEDWPDEKLFFVGTERVRKELFSYEVKPQ